MIDARVLKDLKKLIEENIDPSMFPYCKGNSIRIGSITIRHNKKGYHIYDMRSKKHIETTFSKTAAVAIAKNLAKGQNVVTEVIDLDRVIEKNYNDACFFAHTVRITKDPLKKDISETRLDIAKARTETAKRSLDCMIF
tara:strand:+ start:226 stop:642 length:417 start_codon:yes stop_codon:yes gene_type:complete